MTQMDVGPGKWSTVCAVALSAATLLSAAPASADPSDDAFVAALANEGIALDRNSAVAMAHTVCAGFDRNENSTVLAMRLKKTTDLSLRQSSYFVGVSMSVYCPQHRGLTDNSMEWLNPFPPLM